MKDGIEQLNEELRKARKIHGALVKQHQKMGKNLSYLFDYIDSMIVRSDFRVELSGKK